LKKGVQERSCYQSTTGYYTVSVNTKYFIYAVSKHSIVLDVIEFTIFHVFAKLFLQFSNF